MILNDHGLRITHEGINQRYLKNWADVAKKYALGVLKKLGVGVNFQSFSAGYFLSGRPYSVSLIIQEQLTTCLETLFWLNSIFLVPFLTALIVVFPNTWRNQ